MCYPKVDKTLGAHTWGLSAWVWPAAALGCSKQQLEQARRGYGNLRLHATQRNSSLGHHERVDEPESVGVLHDPKNHAPPTHNRSVS